MKFEITKPAYLVSFEEQEDFLRNLWCKLFDGTSKVMSFAELQDLQCKLKDMPLERFENDRDLKSLVCVGIYAVMTCLAGFPSNLLKKKKFFVNYDCEANALEVRML